MKGTVNKDSGREQRSMGLKDSSVWDTFLRKGMGKRGKAGRSSTPACGELGDIQGASIY